MKIDVVIGNPPYQENTGGGKRGSTAKQIYPFFILRAIELSSKYVTMITPSKWYNDSALKDFRDSFVSNIRYIHDYTNSSTVFNGVDIAGGVNYFLWQRGYSGNCEFVNDNRNIVDKSLRNLKVFDIVIRYSKLQTIIEKIYTTKNISSMVSSQTPFGYTTSDINELSILDDEYYNVKVLGSSGREAYTNIKEIPKGREYVLKYKVMMNHVTSEHAGETDKNGMVNILSSISILGKNEICTQTYMFVGAFDNLCDAKNLEKYIKTKLVRSCILATVASISLSPNNFKYVPLQDFTSNSDIDWSKPISDIDRQLYKKYGLTQEEIDYIESTIKPMN